MPLSVTFAFHAPLLGRLRHAIALLLLLLLSACGAGSSGLPDPPPPPVAAPTITVHPGNRITDEGVAVVFSVQATGGGTLSYQWLRNDVVVPGATQATYTLNTPVASDNGSLWKVQVSNAGGNTTSTTVILTVNTTSSGAPTIDTAPQSQTVSAGSNVTFSVGVSSATAVTYQWQRDGVDLTGATSPTYTLAPAQESDSGSTWRVIATNAAGSTTSSSATLSVTAGLSSAPAITTQPVSQTVASGSMVTFTVAASGSPAPSFQWQRDGIDIPGATADSHVLASVQTTDSGSTWRVIVTNSAGSVTSNSVTLTVQPPPPASTAVIAVLAGALKQPGTASGTPGSFKLPVGMGIDASGNIYVADTAAATVRRISSSGGVLTLAGQADTPGNADGNGSLARFTLPAGIAVDTSGNVYVSDIGNHNIRKITPIGAVTTLAGGTAGFADDDVDDAVSTARFKNPWGVAVDDSGNVYVADTGNNVIRKITPAGLVSTLAGAVGLAGFADGSGDAAHFRSPTGIVMGTDGHLYVVDQGNSVIRKITTAGVVTTVAGLASTPGNADGLGSEARFRTPTGICTDSSGNLYVADSGNNLIRKITPAGAVTTVAGHAGSSSVITGTGGSLNQPLGVTINSSTGMLYTAGDNAVLSITP